MVDLIAEMLLDGLFIDLLKLLAIFAVQEDSIAIIEFGLRHWGLDEFVKNVLTVSLRIRQVQNAVLSLVILHLFNGVTLDVGMVHKLVP